MITASLASSSDAIVLAVPSKGRLKDDAARFFARAGLAFRQSGGGRDYTASIPSLPGVDVQFLSAAEIADHVAAGKAHLGVTGEDLVCEQIADAESRVAKVSELGFGHANVVVAAPQSWIDVASMADVEDVAADFRDKRGRKLRVATKYVNLTRRHFAAHGVSDYRIVASQGATEGAPASGAAELIVDITSSGATLAANGLKIVDDGVILRSQACLFASLGADWTPRALEMAKTILARIAAAETAEAEAEIRAHFVGSQGFPLDSAPVEFGLLRVFAPTIGSSGSLTAHCAAAKASALAEWLIAKGAASVSITRADQIYLPENRLFAMLEAKLARRGV